MSQECPIPESDLRSLARRGLELLEEKHPRHMDANEDLAAFGANILTLFMAPGEWPSRANAVKVILEQTYSRGFEAGKLHERTAQLLGDMFTEENEP